MSRLAAGLWIDAYRAVAEAAGAAVYVAARGDAAAGDVAIKVATLDGRARLRVRVLGPDGARIWETAVDGDEADVDAALARRRRADPDVWVLEVEDRAGRDFLDRPGLSD